MRFFINVNCVLVACSVVEFSLKGLHEKSANAHYSISDSFRDAVMEVWDYMTEAILEKALCLQFTAGRIVWS